MTSQLILTHRKAANCVAINRRATKQLQTYQKNVIRFIYDCFVKQKRGAIVNIDSEMNHEHACSLALKTLYDVKINNLTTIILCNEDRLLYWLYYMKHYSELDVFKISDNNIDRLLKRNEALVLIVVEKDFKIFRNYVKDYNYFCLIVDHVDQLIEKQLTGRVHADFRIGITHRNFVRNADQTKRWKVINWVTPTGTFSKLADFIEYDDAYMKEHIDPYTDFWYTMTWDYCAGLAMQKSSIVEKNEERKEMIRTWSKSAGLLPASPKTPNKDKDRGGNKNVPKAADHSKANLSNVTCFENWWDIEKPDLSVFGVGQHPSTNVVPSTSFLNSTRLTLKKPAIAKTNANNVNSPFRRTKSFFEFDKAAVEEFSKPFHYHQASNIKKVVDLKKKSQSDSVLMKQAHKSDTNETDILAELRDAEVLREFSRHFAPAVSNDNNRLTSLLTGQLKHSDQVIDADANHVVDDNNYASQFVCDANEVTQDELPSVASVKRCFDTDSDEDNFLIKYLKADAPCNKVLPVSVQSCQCASGPRGEDENFLLAFL